MKTLTKLKGWILKIESYFKQIKMIAIIVLTKIIGNIQNDIFFLFLIVTIFARLVIADQIQNANINGNNLVAEKA